MTSINVEYTARVVVDMTPETKRQLKLLAAARDTTVMDLLRGLIDKEIAAYGSGLKLAQDAATKLADRG